MSNPATDYDVIIVGGRVAGSTLAARLGRMNLRVLLLERATFPALPAVSSPIIFSSTMAYLDEIGADEAEYAHNTPKIQHMVSVAAGMTGKVRLPDYKGRDYAYAIDRARFDAALWDTALQYDTVDGQQGFSVTDICFDDTGRVCGIVGKKEGESVQYTSDLVIGADGRFGIVGRKVEAAETDVHDTHPTSIYYAYWENVLPFDADGAASVAYEGNGQYGYLAMDSADNQTVVGVEGRADALQPADDETIEDFYLRILQRKPELWARVEHADRVTSVRGMKQIGNSYRQAGGSGWALTGDAYHQKDPLDGQGIYNAVVTSKALARSIGKYFAGDWNWSEAVAEYDEVARVKTYPMYRALQTRVRTSFFLEGSLPVQIPPQLIQAAGRWMLQDPAFNDLMGKMLTRQLPPDMVTLLAPPTILKALALGPARDIKRRIEERLPFSF